MCPMLVAAWRDALLNGFVYVNNNAFLDSAAYRLVPIELTLAQNIGQTWNLVPALFRRALHP